MAKERKLNLQQEQFCQIFTSSDREFFGNGVQSYIEVYKPDTSKPSWNQTARATVSRMLTKHNIIDRINELLESKGLNDGNIDKQLMYLINQYSDNSNKLGAIREYNKLKQRITEKIDHTTKGEKININLVQFTKK